jgi:hypothetical protein
MFEAFETRPSKRVEAWPALPLAEWQDTYDTLHLCTQVVGKLPLALSPMTNEWWQVAFHTTSRGLTTTPMPIHDRTFEVEFDFVDHDLLVRTSDGATRALALIPRTVAEFYRDVRGILRSLDVHVDITPVPVEMPDPIPFEEDFRHASYDAAAVSRWWQIVRQMDILFKEFRAGFCGKCSPVHFFWGSFDHTVSRFSGRLAPPRHEAARFTRLAYDQECMSVGFWPGGGPVPEPALYSYFAPSPDGFASASIRPSEAYFQTELGEFILPYEAVRRAEHPEDMVLAFAQSTYEAGARLAGWDRAALEWPSATSAR